jgi:hypothetical protein
LLQQIFADERLSTWKTGIREREESNTRGWTWEPPGKTSKFTGQVQGEDAGEREAANR